MVNKVIAGSREPIYRQVARELERRIAAGGKSGAEFSSYRELSEEFGVSLSVIQRAVKELRKNDLVRTQRGRRGELAPADHTQRVMHKYGFIHAYGRESIFARMMPFLVNETFEGMNFNNFVIVRSSDGDGAKEREIAENMVYNGMQGLIVSPVEGGGNSDFFRELAQRIPVVSVDLPLEGTELPCVEFDYRRAGRDITMYLFRKCHARRLLMALVEKMNASIRSFIEGAIETANELGMNNQIETVAVPLDAACHKIKVCNDFSFHHPVVAALEQRVIEGNFDALFSPYNDLLDAFLIMDGFHHRQPQVRLATMSYALTEQHSREYFRARVMEWEQDYGKLFRDAVEILRRWESSGIQPHCRRTIRLNRRFRMSPEESAVDAVTLRTIHLPGL